MKNLMVNKEDAVLVLIDFQEKLLPAMTDAEELEQTVIKLIQGCRVMGTDILVTQQYTKGLGFTTAPITEAITAELFDGYVPAAEFSYIEKTTFSAMKTAEFAEALAATGKKTVILAGIEAHICTQQTCLQLLEKGYNVFVISDAIASRSQHNKECGEKRMAAAGAVVTTYEAVLYEMLGGAGKEGFKQISKIVK